MNQPTYKELQGQLSAYQESNENWKEGFDKITRDLDAADIQIEELKQERDGLLEAAIKLAQPMSINDTMKAMDELHDVIAKVTK